MSSPSKVKKESIKNKTERIRLGRHTTMCCIILFPSNPSSHPVFFSLEPCPVKSLCRDFEAYKTACFAGEGTMLRSLDGPGNTLITKSFLETVTDGKVREAIKASMAKATFVRFPNRNDNTKVGSHGFEYQDCLEGTLPALALFLHRDPYTFASMGLHSNHRLVNAKTFLKPLDDKPSIVGAIQMPGNTSFQTSQVDISFFKIGVRETDDETKPCLQSLCRFDFNDEGCAGK
jgi:hypothetical protein